MAASDFARFCSEYLPQHPDLAKTLDGLAGLRCRAESMTAAGHDAGFDFSVAEAEQGLSTSEQRVREADGELTDEELASVAGGACSLMEATQSVGNSALALQEATQMESRKFHG